MEQAPQRCLKTELADFQKRLHSCFPGVGIGSTIDLQSATLYMDAIRDPNVKFPKFNAALEAGRKRFDDPVSQDRLCAHDHDSNADGSDTKDGNSTEEEPPPFPESAVEWLNPRPLDAGRGWVLCGQVQIIASTTARVQSGISCRQSTNSGCELKNHSLLRSSFRSCQSPQQPHAAKTGKE